MREKARKSMGAGRVRERSRLPTKPGEQCGTRSWNSRSGPEPKAVVQPIEPPWPPWWQLFNLTILKNRFCLLIIKYQ